MNAGQTRPGTGSARRKRQLAMIRQGQSHQLPKGPITYCELGGAVGVKDMDGSNGCQNGDQHNLEWSGNGSGAVTSLRRLRYVELKWKCFKRMKQIYLKVRPFLPFISFSFGLPSWLQDPLNLPPFIDRFAKKSGQRSATDSTIFTPLLRGSHHAQCRAMSLHVKRTTADLSQSW